MCSLTQGSKVAARESAEVKVEALQVCEVSQVGGEAVQSPGQTLVTGQVQLCQSREGLKRPPCRRTGWEGMEVIYYIRVL